MSSNHDALRNELADLCDGYEFECGDGSAVLEVFEWDPAKGPLSCSALLEADGLVRKATADELTARFQSWKKASPTPTLSTGTPPCTLDEHGQGMQRLADALGPHVKALERLLVDNLVISSPRPYSFFLIGELADGTWLGLGPRNESSGGPPVERVYRHGKAPDRPAGISDAAWTAILPIVSETPWIAHPDTGAVYKGWTFVDTACHAAPSRAALLDALAASASGNGEDTVQLATKSGWAEFQSRSRGEDEDEDEDEDAAEMAAKAQGLNSFFGTKLTQVQLYEIGGWEGYDQFTVGQTPDGRMLGVRARRVHRPIWT